MIFINPKERVFNRLEGKKVDKIPNLNIIMTFAAQYIDVPYREYVTDYNNLVEGNIQCCKEFGIDMVSAISDPCREGYDLGAEVEFPADDVPHFDQELIKDYSDLDNLDVINPRQGERMLDRIKAIELYEKRVGDQYPILGWVEGALAEACDLRGMNNLMFDLHDNPEFVHQLLDFCTEQAIEFALEQVKAGADFIGIGDAAASVIGPQNYQNFVLHYEKKICQAIHETGAKVKLHICGDITPLLDMVVETEADIIDVDWMVDFKDAVNTFRGKAAACGNFDPVGILLKKNSDQVREAVEECIKVSNDDTFIAAGCEVPKDTPYENMYAVTKTLKQ